MKFNFQERIEWFFCELNNSITNFYNLYVSNKCLATSTYISGLVSIFYYYGFKNYYNVYLLL